MAEVSTPTSIASTTAVITLLNGPVVNAGQEWVANTDVNGNLVFIIATAYSANSKISSVIHVQPTIPKLDGDEKSKKAPITHFMQLQQINNAYALYINRTTVNIENHYVFANDFKYN
ncbi:hypothetical protein ACIQYS_09200 [Psychrobacillus sp. NPDC096426]|uniref:hypothetical protein n=1 Tax=Psychrobacillus sp. NPDC096426 TaxID=3364491 RepID=UPI0037F1529D